MTKIALYVISSIVGSYNVDIKGYSENVLQIYITGHHPSYETLQTEVCSGFGQERPSAEGCPSLEYTSSRCKNAARLYSSAKIPSRASPGDKDKQGSHCTVQRFFQTFGVLCPIEIKES